MDCKMAFLLLFACLVSTTTAARARQTAASARVDSDSKANSSELGAAHALPRGFQKQYPKCSKTLQDLGMGLEDLKLTKEEVAKIFAVPLNCSWWESAECDQSHAEQVAHEYLLRKTLVGQPDPRGPTLYTPPAQHAVVKTMRKLANELLQRDQKNPDLKFMASVFEGINVEDTGSLHIRIVNAFAHTFNRGKGEVLYRSKDVKTKPYKLSNWGKNMKQKIKASNNLLYLDRTGHAMKALELHGWGFGKTSFVYKYPPLGIKHELQKRLDAFIAKSPRIDDFSNLVVFKMAEKWIRDLVILHPFIDSNGRSARVSLNILLLLNGLAPIVMARQDEDMSSTPAELRDRICEGMAYSKNLIRKLPDVQREASSSPPGSQSFHCCSAQYKLHESKPYCVTLPISLGCDKFAEFTQSKRYLPWEGGTDCGAARSNISPCSPDDA